VSSSQRLALVIAAAALLVGGFLVARGSTEDTVTTAPGTPAVTAASTPESVTTGAATAAPTVVVSGGKPEGGVQDLTFAKGDAVAFTVRSDVADEIHVHGYDVKKVVAAGGTVMFSFKATIDGIFEVELENAAVQIASLKVNP
jgi:hypothetical protein